GPHPRILRGRYPAVDRSRDVRSGPHAAERSGARGTITPDREVCWVQIQIVGQDLATISQRPRGEGTRATAQPDRIRGIRGAIDVDCCSDIVVERTENIVSAEVETAR